jgi:hypothetical protein
MLSPTINHVLAGLCDTMNFEAYRHTTPTPTTTNFNSTTAATATTNAASTTAFTPWTPSLNIPTIAIDTTPVTILSVTVSHP